LARDAWRSDHKVKLDRRDTYFDALAPRDGQGVGFHAVAEDDEV